MTELCAGIGEISDAMALFSIMREDRIRREDNMFRFSTKGNPLHYVGNRKAKTVLVMLNPGGDWENGDRRGLEERKALHKQTHKELIGFQHKRLTSFGRSISESPGAFDLKQAAFLKRWPESGIEIHPTFPGTKDESIKLSVVKSVLSDKLQLELIPYCSNRFDTEFFREENCVYRLEPIVPFLETVLHEIGQLKRKYVVFCSKVFEPLFKAYEENHPGTFTGMDSDPKESRENKRWHCRPVWIHYSDHVQPALIAHTFPSYGLRSGGKQMVGYGRFCYSCFLSANEQMKRKQGKRRTPCAQRR